MTDEEVAQRWEKAQAVQQELKDRERARRHKPIPKAVRQKVYEKYDGHCAYCGKPIEYKEMQVDHIQAHYLGGADEMDNYNPACRMCNFYKGTMSIDRFREELRKLQERLKKVYIYRLALRYGLVEEKENKVVFYFESKEREKGE
ncbi:HNH endonuclease [Megasphaera elsdenii]|uniref:HNH endonuclease n=1 Tax=Megasphaera elsdenii TaxID=907 RepID=UPI0025844608|nr:HNH endonuclease signature motif containing protein [Megasphaera elsdenii]MCI7200469.1 HNH endonuclease [Megasphaera elsdenii]MDY4265584.1 HNH endonuclease signature motif containing protein [Megasphaera elsdenii]